LNYDLLRRQKLEIGNEIGNYYYYFITDLREESLWIWNPRFKSSSAHLISAEEESHWMRPSSSPYTTTKTKTNLPYLFVHTDSVEASVRWINEPPC
jgi:hypothetical protein